MATPNKYIKLYNIIDDTMKPWLAKLNLTLDVGNCAAWHRLADNFWKILWS